TLMALLPIAAGAQDKKHEAQLRTVRGVVTDKSDNPLSGSVVFLKNMRTNSVRSSYTDDTGSYRFSGLDPNADYELHAEKDNAKWQGKVLHEDLEGAGAGGGAFGCGAASSAAVRTDVGEDVVKRCAKKFAKEKDRDSRRQGQLEPGSTD